MGAETAGRSVHDTDFKLVRSIDEIPDFQLFSLGIVYAYTGIDYSITERYTETTGRPLRGSVLRLGRPVFDKLEVYDNVVEVIPKEAWEDFLTFLVGSVSKDVGKAAGLCLMDRRSRMYWKIIQCHVSILDPFARFPSSSVPRILRLPVFGLSGNKFRVIPDVGIRGANDMASLLKPVHISFHDPHPSIVEEANRVFEGDNVKEE